ncbi:alkylmercury lyase family protein [Kibdelosporangium aridum]|uniref:Alkylmercury lyase n=1 Tax=Kibdelosporangium aridum TaxID=2030 RepID=A0A1W2FMG5_KIBAR|nr:alkylmercury lyase family protein [Kibdelosporangium aridum]SMD22944.1 Alkylmercury lyase [Kibdelosporangium aridum]
MDRADPQLTKCSAVGALGLQARRLHHLLLTHFAETGHAPNRLDLNTMAHDHGVEPDSAIEELIARDLFAVDDHGEIRAAYPFSPKPTNHVITWSGGPRTYAMCAIDALGISAMLDRPVTITSAEPATGTTITIEVDRHKAHWSPASAVVLAGATDDTCCASVDRTCSHINFFTGTTAAEIWQAAHPHITSTVLTQQEALSCAIAEFGDFMRFGRPL